MNTMNIEITQANSCIEVLVSGEIDVYTAPRLKEVVYPLASQDQVEMVINLSGVSFMDLHIMNEVSMESLHSSLPRIQI